MSTFAAPMLHGVSSRLAAAGIAAIQTIATASAILPLARIACASLLRSGLIAGALGLILLQPKVFQRLCLRRVHVNSHGLSAALREHVDERELHLDAGVPRSPAKPIRHDHPVARIDVFQGFQEHAFFLEGLHLLRQEMQNALPPLDGATFWQHARGDKNDFGIPELLDERPKIGDIARAIRLVEHRVAPPCVFNILLRHRVALYRVRGVTTPSLYRLGTLRKETLMAVVVVNEIEGGSQDFYDKVNPKVMPGGQLPDGCQVHIAGPIENGWRVITVWDSDERFQEFRNETLIPAMRDVGDEGRIAPSISAKPVYKLLTP